MNNKHGFMICVDRKYQEYVPAFVYFLNKSYPDATPIILSNDILDKSYREYINSITDCLIIDKISIAGSNSMNIDQIKCLRWLSEYEEFYNFEYMYIGDADMAIMKESPSLIEQHSNHCRETGLPYSNFQRQVSPLKRLSGIHIIKTREWFDSVRTTLEQYLYKVFNKFDTLKYSNIGFNEQLLYDIISNSNLSVPSNLTSSYNHHIISSHHHGIHLRLFEHQGLNGILNVKGNHCFKKQFCDNVGCHDFKKLYNVSNRIALILNKLKISWENLI